MKKKPTRNKRCQWAMLIDPALKKKAMAKARKNNVSLTFILTKITEQWVAEEIKLSLDSI